jgi:rhamnulokinase
MANEYSIASTTQLFNPVNKNWSAKLLDKLGINKNIFLDNIIKPGTKIGNLLPSVSGEIAAESNVVVIAPACHDTGSAVAAVPHSGSKNYAYLSSGTWSLLGIETPEPVINEKSLKYNFTNEGAANGGIRLLKNIMGLWILQECKRTWDREGKIYTYNELMKMAEDNGPAGFKIDPDNPVFFKPGIIDNSMVDRIKEYCTNTKQIIPLSIAEITRGIIESLAEVYKKTIREIEEVSGKNIEVLYIIGGGCQNSLLCEITSKKLKVPVIAGPAEATAIGNILIQMISLGEIKSIEQGRKMIKESYEIKEYNL